MESPSSAADQLTSSFLVLEFASANSTIGSAEQTVFSNLTATVASTRRDEERPFFSSTTAPASPSPATSSSSSTTSTSRSPSRSTSSKATTAKPAPASSISTTSSTRFTDALPAVTPSFQDNLASTSATTDSSTPVPGLGLTLESTFTLARSEITVSFSSDPPTATTLVTSPTITPTSESSEPSIPVATPSPQTSAEPSAGVVASSSTEAQSSGAISMVADGIGMSGETTMGSIETGSVTLASALAPTGSPSTADFVLPGRQLSVLPIGLGVFAGVSVVALLIVGIVTYERKKYRRQFRERRMAEQAQAQQPVGRGPGYGTIGGQMRQREGVV